MKELKCKDCGRHLGDAGGTIIAELRCSNSSCRATTQFKIINADISQDVHFKFAQPEKPPKTKAITLEDTEELRPEVS